MRYVQSLVFYWTIFESIEQVMLVCRRNDKSNVPSTKSIVSKNILKKWWCSGILTRFKIEICQGRCLHIDSKQSTMPNKVPNVWKENVIHTYSSRSSSCCWDNWPQCKPKRRHKFRSAIIFFRNKIKGWWQNMFSNWYALHYILCSDIGYYLVMCTIINIILILFLGCSQKKHYIRSSS